jgi:hypothetical protein
VAFEAQGETVPSLGDTKICRDVEAVDDAALNGSPYVRSSDKTDFV